MVEHRDYEEKSSMLADVELDWKVPVWGIGSAVLAGALFIFTFWNGVQLDHSALATNVKDNATIIDKLNKISEEQLRVAATLPLTDRDIRDQKERLAALQKAYDAMQDNQVRLAQNVAVIGEQIRLLTLRLDDTIAASKQQVIPFRR